MATFTSFEEIEAWQRARRVANELRDVFSRERARTDFGLMDQVNRSTGSIMDNIAEGFERGGNREFIQFLSISKGSAGEAKSQLYRMLDRKYISQVEFERWYKELQTIAKMIGGLMVFLKGSDFKGPKYHEPESIYHVEHHPILPTEEQPPSPAPP